MFTSVKPTVVEIPPDMVAELKMLANLRYSHCEKYPSNSDYNRWEIMTSFRESIKLIGLQYTVRNGTVEQEIKITVYYRNAKRECDTTFHQLGDNFEIIRTIFARCCIKPPEYRSDRLIAIEEVGKIFNARTETDIKGVFKQAGIYLNMCIQTDRPTHLLVSRTGGDHQFSHTFTVGVDWEPILGHVCAALLNSN